MSTTTNNNYSSDGIGLLGATFLVFLTLKLCGVITWSWWWVTAPLWGTLVLVLAWIGIIFIVVFVFGMLRFFYKEIFSRK